MLYTTGLWCLNYEASPPAPFRGRGWSIGTRHYEFKGRNPDADVEAFAARRGFSPPVDTFRTLKDGRIHWKSASELVIYARSQESAQRAANLLFAARLAMQGSSGFLDMIAAVPDHVDEWETRQHRYALLASEPNLRKAAALATRLSASHRLHYAAMKLWISHRACTPEPMDFDPHAGIHHGVTGDPYSHVAFAQAIANAYGVLEELGLEIRASRDQPAKIDGEWNPTVKSDIESRLRKAKVNLNEPISWVVRGAPTRIEAKRSIPTAGRSAWAYGPVRDRESEVVDAIAHASWLRSRVSAHRSSHLTRSLTLVDVHNMQMLARRLLLEAAGFWRV